MVVSSLALSGGPALRAPAPVMSGAKPLRKAEWIPGAMAPSYLDGSLPGDRGFDPAALVPLARTGTKYDTSPWKKQDRKYAVNMMSKYEAKRKVAWMREAEIKHGRLAMVAAVGWPVSEMLDSGIANLFGLPDGLAASGGRAPSLLNGGLFENWPFLLLVAIGISALELKTLDNVEGLTPEGYTAGDLGFDPLNLREKRADMPLIEIKHCRLAMLAIVGDVVQEAVYGKPVIEQTPQFFKPFFLM